MAQKNETPALIVALLVTLGLIGGGIWWLTQRSNLLGGLPATSTPSPANVPEAASPTSSSPTGGGDLTSIANVPSGLFSYGGSTTWAPIRGSVDSTITAAFPPFQLRYTEPLSGPAGSSTGIRMLLDNQLAFAQSSRSPRPEEYQAAQQRGFTLKEIPVALEGIAIAVYPELNVPRLTIA